MSTLLRFLRDDRAVVTVEWSVLAGFAAVGCTMHVETIGMILDRALDQTGAGLRQLLR